MGKLRPPRGTGKGPLGTPAPQIKIKSAAEIKEGAKETLKHFQGRLEELRKKVGK